MSLRDFLNRNPAVAGGIGVVIIVIALTTVFRSSAAGSKQDQAWFYDVQTGQLFAADRGASSPVDAPSGAGNGVATVLLGCGECPAEPSKPTWLEKMTPQALAVEKKMLADDPITISQAEQRTYDMGRLISLPPQPGEKPAWFPAESAQGKDAKQKLISSACANGGKPHVCLPDSP